MRGIKLVKAINNELKIRKMQHVQALIRVVGDQFCIKFVSVDTEALKEKVNILAHDYCESLYLVAESKTTVTYRVA